MSASRLILLSCLIEVLSMSTVSTFPALIPVFQREWGLSDVEVGWINGAIPGGELFALMIFTPLTDRLDPKRIFMAALALGVISGFGFAFLTDDFSSAVLWRFLQGFAIGGSYLPGLRILTDHLPANTRSRGTSFYTGFSFLAGALSYFIALDLEPRLGWQTTALITASGPLLALIMSLFVMPSGRNESATTVKPSLVHYRAALADRRIWGFSLLYAIHNLELIAFGSWLVPFLVFSQSLQSSGGVGVDWHLGGLVAAISAVALPASIMGNEFSHKIGRQSWVIIIMVVSAVAGLTLGASTSLPFLFVVAGAFVFSALTAADSSTITAGLVQIADPAAKGAVMTVYAVIGHLGSALGPIIFGIVLQVMGGGTNGTAWMAAFATVAAFMVLGPIVTWKFVGLRPVLR